MELADHPERFTPDSLTLLAAAGIQRAEQLRALGPTRIAERLRETVRKQYNVLLTAMTRIDGAKPTLPTDFHILAYDLMTTAKDLLRQAKVRGVSQSGNAIA